VLLGGPASIGNKVVITENRVASILIMLIVGAGAACASVADPLSSGTVEVVRNSGLKQCDDEAPAPETFAKVLQANGVKVLSSSCASDGAKRPQMCGLDRGLFYVYEIEVVGLSKAVSLGFTEIKKIPGAAQFRKVPCPAPK
jgi:hypothetical protein